MSINIPQTPDDDISDTDMIELEGEVVVLAQIRAFTDRALQVSWFSALGEPLSDATRRDAQSYVDGLGFPDAYIAQLDGWEDAANAAESMDINAQSWEAEEQLRAALTDEALQMVSEEGLGVLLTHLASALVEPVEDALGEALYLADEVGAVGETGAGMAAGAENIFVKLALGGVQQACHGAALAIAGITARHLLDGEAVDEKEIEAHPLMIRFRLFEQGRWPVSLIGNSLNLL